MNDDKQKPETLKMVGAATGLVLVFAALCLIPYLTDRLVTFIGQYISVLTPLLLEFQIALLRWIPLIGIGLGLMIVYHLAIIHKEILGMNRNVSNMLEIVRKQQDAHGPRG